MDYNLYLSKYNNFSYKRDIISPIAFLQKRKTEQCRMTSTGDISLEKTTTRQEVSGMGTVNEVSSH